tara:strand:- start:52 stop:609 length:558 start_codon:yes stop_codon:yes gene_type:complete
MEVQSFKLTKVKPYWRNARDNDKTIEALKKSIQEFGFNQPLVIDSKNVLIAGHARYRALKELGYKEAPCIVADLDDDKAKAYRIADNKIHELTAWNEDDLILELRELGSDLMQDFFPDKDLDDWLDQSLGLKVNPVTSEEVAETGETLEGVFKARDGASQTYWEVICPECAHEFLMDVGEVKNKI